MTRVHEFHLTHRDLKWALMDYILKAYPKIDVGGSDELSISKFEPWDNTEDDRPCMTLTWPHRENKR